MANQFFYWFELPRSLVYVLEFFPETFQSFLMLVLGHTDQRFRHVVWEGMSEHKEELFQLIIIFDLFN